MKVFKVILIVLVVIVAVIYGGVFLGHKVIFPVAFSDVPTINGVHDEKFHLGNQHSGDTIEEYLKIFAKQVTKYHEIATKLWPDNKANHQTIIVEEINTSKFWRIHPDGAMESISQKEALTYDFQRNRYFNGFDFFEGGAYIAVSKEDLNNHLIHQQYLHLGTYDPFITFVHEEFHGNEQRSWASLKDVPNLEREEYIDNLPARAKRALLQQQLLDAIAQPEQPELILNAVATYEDYKLQFPQEAELAIHTDRIEGTAYYLELIASLYSGYPDQIQNEDDLKQALSLLATRKDVYIDYGLVVEGYNVGGFAGILLDRIHENWKQELMQDATLSPIELLSRHYQGTALPEAVQLTQEDIDNISSKIEQKTEGNGPDFLFKALYNLLF